MLTNILFVCNLVNSVFFPAQDGIFSVSYVCMRAKANNSRAYESYSLEPQPTRPWPAIARKTRCRFLRNTQLIVSTKTLRPPIVLSGNWSVWDTLRYWLAESFFRNGGIWQNKRFMTNIPSVGPPAFPLYMDFFLYHPPVSLLGRRATGRMCLSTQVLSSSRIRSTSKPTQARWKVLMEGKTSTKPILVCAAVA